MKTKPRYRMFATCIGAWKRCIASNNKDWEPRWKEHILSDVKRTSPSGSGWDMGTKIDLESSTDEKLVFFGEYHHMDGSGYYDGWTQHTITVSASLTDGFKLKISGRNRNEIKDYLHELFSTWLLAELDEKEWYPGKEEESTSHA